MRYLIFLSLLLLVMILLSMGCATRMAAPTSFAPTTFDLEMRQRDFRRMSAALRDCQTALTPLEYMWLRQRYQQVEDVMRDIDVAINRHSNLRVPLARFDHEWDDFNWVLLNSPYSRCKLYLPQQNL